MSPRALLRACALGVLLGCSGPADAPTSAPEPVAAPEPALAPAPVPAPASVDAALPAPAWHATTCNHASRVSMKPTAEVDAARALLVGVVSTYGLDPDNAWALGHSLLALGPDAKLANGESAVDHLFTTWGETVVVGDEKLVRFPAQRGDVRVEPHTDLVLKALTEIGLAHDRPVVVEGEPRTLGHLYRGSLARAWVDGEQTAFDSWNDTPWALQGLAAFAPDDLAWTADGGHAMTMNAFTHAVVGKLHAENAFIREAYAAKQIVKKRRQGVFGYTCGGAHLLQGAAFAVGRGFGDDADRAAVIEDIDSMFYRLNVEIRQVDEALQSAPDYRPILLVQRLKFLGHFLETMHKASALGLWSPDGNEADMLERAVAETVATAMAMEKLGVIAKMPEIRPTNEQFYLDVIGDSAHAIRGLDLATGRAKLCF